MLSTAIESVNMPLSASTKPGDQLGPYEILAPIGEGGMGAVWKARDTRLDRIVAIKVASVGFSERFEREARSVAAFNHPNICQLYDVGPNYLVMELVDGEPLKGPLAVDKAVEYAKQILDALDAAHKKGIIHRDLKPANIMVSKQGIKLLDFGLAKHAGPLKETDATMVAGITGQDTIVGTLQYMSPEQLQNQPADARCDLFAFGCVLYEMISGKRAFSGDSSASLIGAILHREPEPLDIDPPLDRVIKRCLAKDPDERFQTARDLKYNLALAMEPSIAASRQAATSSSKLPWIAAAALATALVVSLYFRPAAVEQATTAFHIESPENEHFHHAAISPNGKNLVIEVDPSDGTDRTYFALRPMDSPLLKRLPQTEGARNPFWSPDSRFVGFSQKNKLKKIDIASGTITLIGEFPGTGSTSRGAWNPDGAIVSAQGAAVYRIMASGGPFAKLPTQSGETRRHPFWLPDGKRYVYFVNGRGLLLGSVDSDKSELVVEAESGGRFVPSKPGSSHGHLLYIRDNALMARPFNASKVQSTGEPIQIANPVYNAMGNSAMAFSVSENGVLAYRGSSIETGLRQYTMGGEVTDLAANCRCQEVAVSPDGKQLALTVGEGNRDVWLRDIQRGVQTRFTFEVGTVGAPVWSPDSNRLAFSAKRGDKEGIFQKRANGASGEEILLASNQSARANDWSPDGRFMVYSTVDAETGSDLWLLPLSGDAKPIPYLQTKFNENHAQISPDGRFLAYESNESGSTEVYVRTFPDPAGGKWKISTQYGGRPRWSKSGREIYFMGISRQLNIAEVKTGTALEVVKTRMPFILPASTYTVGRNLNFSYAVLDGKSVVGITEVGDGTWPVTVVLNWLAPVK